MGLGARKYGPFNWRTSPVRATVYIAAAKRRLAQWLDGQNDDPESGVSHLAHARACLGILLDAQSLGKVVDDRPPYTRTFLATISDLICRITHREEMRVMHSKRVSRAVWWLRHK